MRNLTTSTQAISKASQENILAYTQNMIHEIERKKTERDEKERREAEASQGRDAVVPFRAMRIPRELGYSSPEMQRQAQREASIREHDPTASARRDESTGYYDRFNDRDRDGGARRRKSKRRKSKRNKKTHRNKH